MKVSIIIPVFNVAKYINDTLLSIETQNFNDYEVIIINDGSTDDTKDIIEKWEKKDKRIKVINQNNNGLSYSRKVGLKNASGEYVYFCDGDDLLTEGSLSFMYNKAKQFSLDLLMINAKYKNELKNSFGQKKANTLVWNYSYPKDIMSGQDLLNLMIDNLEWRYAVWLYFTKKELLDKIDFFKNFVHEDSAHNYQLLNTAKKVKVFNRVCYLYRLRENSIMGKKVSLKNVDGYINSFNVIYEYNQKFCFNDETKYKFEKRIFQQLIDVVKELNKNEIEKARKKINKIFPKIYSRDFYYQSEIENFFNLKKIEINNLNRADIKDYIEYLEIHVVDHCNLNCANCCHFSPFAPVKFLDLKKYEKDINKLSNLINGRLKSLVLMGGEPLLHSEIVEIIKITKKAFLKTNIQLLTNGILLNNMKNSFWRVLKELDIQINITKYPINFDYESVLNRIKQEGIRYFIYADGKTIKYFDVYCFDEKGSKCKEENFYRKCVLAKDYAFFRDGKIFPCQLSDNIRFYNEKFKKNIPQSKSDFIDIYEIDEASDIYKFLSKPIPFCSFCDFDNSKKALWKINNENCSNRKGKK